MSQLFDRLNRYRIAAVILVIPGILNIFRLDLDLIDVPTAVIRGIYWVGIAVLVAAVSIDGWQVYQGRRRVRKMIDNAMKGVE